MNIGIVTDSTSDIPYSLANQYQINIIPNLLVIDGKEIEDGEYFSRQEFYEKLPTLRTLPTTATASIGAYETIYSALLSKGCTEILSIHPSKLLSGIFNAASAAAKSIGGAIHVIDSQQVSLGLGFQVLAAAEAVLAGLTIEKVLEHIEDIRKRVHVVAMLDTLEYIHRSGRVSWARASLGSLLRIKPFVEVRNGVVKRLVEVRTRAKGIAHLVEILHSLAPLERLAVLHTNAERDARQLLDMLNVQLSYPALLVNITTVIGTHVGPNGLGFAAVTTQT